MHTIIYSEGYTSTFKDSSSTRSVDPVTISGIAESSGIWFVFYCMLTNIYTHIYIYIYIYILYIINIYIYIYPVYHNNTKLVYFNPVHLLLKVTSSVPRWT